MILSVSRRTDIPAFYFDWFLNRLKEGFLLVRNPFNPSQVSRLALAPPGLECIVFWTKNPQPMLARLCELEPYPYYIQFTLHHYGLEIESRLPELESRLDTFRRLSELLGRERMVWRYSPIILGGPYTVEYHLDAFGRLASALSGYTDECKLSFLEFYSKIAGRMASLGLVDGPVEEKYALAQQLESLAREQSIAVSACGQPDLRPAGIALSSCIDGRRIQKVTGRPMSLRKDPNQRGVCNCVKSIDVGSYQTCLNGCVYCYANHSHSAACRKAARYQPLSPLLCDQERPGDKISDRKIRLHGEDRLIF